MAAVGAAGVEAEDVSGVLDGDVSRVDVVVSL